MHLLDASALLAYLRGEPGTEVVDAILRGAVVSAVNWSETLQKVAFAGDDIADVAGLLSGARVEVEPVWREDAELAAALWPTNRSLSLADRLCLATATRLGAIAVTADRSWADADFEADVLVIRG